MIRISATINAPEYECDVTKVLDHQHPGFIDCILDVSDDFDFLEYYMQEAVIVDLINKQIGVCILAGDLEGWEEVDLGGEPEPREENY